MGIQHNVSARPLIDIYPGSHRRMKLSINGYQMIFSKTFPSMTNDLPHLWSVLIAQLKAWISKASYNIPLNCQWSIAFAVAACTSAKLLFFQTQFCIIRAYHIFIISNIHNPEESENQFNSFYYSLMIKIQVNVCSRCKWVRCPGVPTAALDRTTVSLQHCSTAAPQHINSSLSPVRGEDISLHSYQLKIYQHLLNSNYFHPSEERLTQFI